MTAPSFPEQYVLVEGKLTLTKHTEGNRTINCIGDEHWHLLLTSPRLRDPTTGFFQVRQSKIVDALIKYFVADHYLLQDEGNRALQVLAAIEDPFLEGSRRQPTAAHHHEVH